MHPPVAKRMTLCVCVCGVCAGKARRHRKQSNVEESSLQDPQDSPIANSKLLRRSSQTEVCTIPYSLLYYIRRGV